MFKLKWSDPAPPNGSSCYYDHCTSQSPLGEFRIEWKSWKDHPSYIIYLDEEYLDCGYDLEEAKKLAQNHIEEIRKLLNGDA